MPSKSMAVGGHLIRGKAALSWILGGRFSLPALMVTVNAGSVDVQNAASPVETATDRMQPQTLRLVVPNSLAGRRHGL